MPALAVGRHSSHMSARRWYARPNSPVHSTPEPRESLSRCHCHSQKPQMMAGPVDGRFRLNRHFLVPRRAMALMEAGPIHRLQTALKKRRSRRWMIRLPFRQNRRQPPLPRRQLRPHPQPSPHPLLPVNLRPPFRQRSQYRSRPDRRLLTRELRRAPPRTASEFASSTS